MNFSFCCPICFKDIAHQKYLAARLWMDLCKVYIQIGIFGVRDCGFMELMQFLEVNGYITTTEDATHIWINVNGFSCDEDSNEYVCIKNHELRDIEYEDL